MEEKRKKPVINAHAHVFTGQFVPPYLARTIAPWPLWRLIRVDWVVKGCRWFYKNRNRDVYLEARAQRDDSQREEQLNAYREKVQRKKKRVLLKHQIENTVYIAVPFALIKLWVMIIATFMFIEVLTHYVQPDPSVLEPIGDVAQWMVDHYLYYSMDWGWQFLWLTVILLVLPKTGKFILMVSSNIWGFLKKLPGDNTMGVIERYIALGRFAFYDKQEDVAERALHQLPDGSGLVILPMDMEYMGAGKAPISKQLIDTKQEKLGEGWEENDFKNMYHYQMREIWDFTMDKKKTPVAPKDRFFPFIFIDPRRISEDSNYFKYSTSPTGEIVLEECFVKTYIEDRRFSGFKIYPALGYYAFDERLLPLWLYAAQNQIPIMTHCVKGVIYYRGAKEKAWCEHPVFRERGAGDERLILFQSKNVDFQINFTHPLNYLCMLEETLLRELVGGSDDSNLHQAFGYTDPNTPMQRNLSQLKVCLAHFGGQEEWERYLEQDRTSYSQRLMREPKEAINFMENNDGDFSWNKLHQIWHLSDWYSIICSLLIRYENMYTDISFIISKEPIYALLTRTLQKAEDYEEEKATGRFTGQNKLRSRVLFGTDFYVVRNHKSDKDIFVETQALLSEEDFDLIARENTHNYLSRKYPNEARPAATDADLATHG